MSGSGSSGAHRVGSQLAAIECYQHREANFFHKVPHALNVVRFVVAHFCSWAGRGRRCMWLRQSCAAVLFELPHPIWALWISLFPRLLHDGLSFFGPVPVGLDEKPARRVLDDFKLYWLRKHNRTNEAGAAHVPRLFILTVSRDASKHLGSFVARAYRCSASSRCH
jgi:hypothetical protein